MGVNEGHDGAARPGDTNRGADLRGLAMLDAMGMLDDVDASDFAGIDAVCDLAALSNDPSGEIDPGLTQAINHGGRRRVSADRTLRQFPF